MSKARSAVSLSHQDASADASDATREKILRAAATAFASSGFDGATFRDIGADAGINFQSIRYHFGTKEKLWEAVVERLSDEAENAFKDRERILAALSPRERLRSTVHAIVEYQAKHPDLQRILLREAMKGSARYRKAFKRHVKRLERKAAADLGQLQAEGVVKAGIVIEDLFYAFRGAINYRLVAPAVGDTRGNSRTIKPEIVDRHAEVIFRMLVAE